MERLNKRKCLFVRSRTNISVLFVRSRTNISVLFVRSRTNISVLFVRSRTNSFAGAIRTALLYTGQAAQLIRRGRVGLVQLIARASEHCVIRISPCIASKQCILTILLDCMVLFTPDYLVNLVKRLRVYVKVIIKQATQSRMFKRTCNQL